MNNLSDFLSYLQTQADNGSIYVWGAQGQVATNSLIEQRETSTVNKNRAKKLLQKRLSAGYDPKKILAFDCSGLGMYFLQNYSKLIVCDLNANGLKGQCTMVSLGELKKGDWVFRLYTSGTNKGRAHHIGYVVDDALNVIESKGRDDGVVKRSLNASGYGYWNAYGRPILFAQEINAQPVQAEPAPAGWSLARVLKKTSPLMSGNDVASVQKALIQKGYSCGRTGADGFYGDNTAAAVKAFQKTSGLTADGKTGKYTCRALGGEWNGN